MEETTSIILKIDFQFYPKEAVFSAFEVFSTDYVFSHTQQGNMFGITVIPRFGQKIDKATFENSFYDEINNQIIRDRILSKTQNLREMIVGKALLGSGAFYDEHLHFDLTVYPSEENYIVDPNHIADTFRYNETKQN